MQAGAASEMRWPQSGHKINAILKKHHPTKRGCAVSDEIGVWANAVFAAYPCRGENESARSTLRQEVAGAETGRAAVVEQAHGGAGGGKALFVRNFNLGIAAGSGRVYCRDNLRHMWLDKAPTSLA
jgi:hypothetical protein